MIKIIVAIIGVLTCARKGHGELVPTGEGVGGLGSKGARRMVCLRCGRKVWR